MRKLYSKFTKYTKTKRKEINMNAHQIVVKTHR